MADGSCPIGELAAGFHHQNPKILEDPWPLYQRFRSECPIARSDLYGGFWILSRYDDILDAASNPGTFSSAHGAVIPSMTLGMPLLPFEVDPPRHSAYRRLLMRRFSAAAVQLLEPFANAEADRLLDGLDLAGRADLVNDYALPLTAAVFGQLLTLPETDRLVLAHWTNQIMERVSDPPAAAAAIRSLTGYMDRMIQARREDPKEDILGLLLTAEIEGSPLSHEEILSLCFTFVLAGLETTVIAIGAALLYLARHPGLKHRFREHDELLGLAVEEFLRIEPPAQAHARTLTADVEIHGRKLQAGDRILLLWASANRDPDQFPDPDRFIPDRHPNRHFTFGAGPHRCLGADLARMEIQVAIRNLLRRFPDYWIEDDAQVVSFKPARGPRTLPVVLRARSGQSPPLR